MLRTMVAPSLLVVLDMGTDINILTTMWQHWIMLLFPSVPITNYARLNSTIANVTDPQGSQYVGAHGITIAFLSLVSTLILLFSTLSLLVSSPLSSLLWGAHTTVAMGSRQQEEQDAALPLGEFTSGCLPQSLSPSHPDSSRHGTARELRGGRLAVHISVALLPHRGGC